MNNPINIEQFLDDIHNSETHKINIYYSADPLYVKYKSFFGYLHQKLCYKNQEFEMLSYEVNIKKTDIDFTLDYKRQKTIDTTKRASIAVYIESPIIQWNIDAIIERYDLCPHISIMTINNKTTHNFDGVTQTTVVGLIHDLVHEHIIRKLDEYHACDFVGNCQWIHATQKFEYQIFLTRNWLVPDQVTTNDLHKYIVEYNSQFKHG